MAVFAREYAMAQINVRGRMNPRLEQFVSVFGTPHRGVITPGNFLNRKWTPKTFDYRTSNFFKGPFACEPSGE